VKVLVTGGAGFIGSHTVEALLRRGDEVVCLDNFNDYYDPARKRRNLEAAVQNPACRVYEADIRDRAALEDVFAAERVDRVVHLAAMAGVLPSIKSPALYEEVNVRGTLNLLDLARQFRHDHFVFASSSSVYGSNTKVPFEETDPVDRPISPYAATKRAAELLAYSYSHLHGFSCAALRLFTVYGPRGRPDMAPYRFTQSIAEGRPLKMFGDGSTRRDYTYIDDIVSGILSALDRPLGYEIFNLGNSTPVELRRFITVVEEAVGRKAVIERMDLQPGDVPVTYASTEKARRLLSYNPQTSIEEGMRRFVDWYRDAVGPAPEVSKA
jgi:UDP-glucuronate 4-epimerase